MNFMLLTTLLLQSLSGITKEWQACLQNIYCKCSIYAFVSNLRPFQRSFIYFIYLFILSLMLTIT